MNKEQQDILTLFKRVIHLENILKDAELHHKSCNALVTTTTTRRIGGVDWEISDRKVEDCTCWLKDKFNE